MMRAKRQLKKKSGGKTKRPFLNRKGQSFVEFVFVLIIFLVLFCLLTGFIQIAYNWGVLQYAASEGSRFGSIGILDPGFADREANIQSRVLQITQDLGVEGVHVEFFDQAGGATAGGASEYFTLKLTRTLEFQGLPGFFFNMAGYAEGVTPHYEVIAWTVIRNEPF